MALGIDTSLVGSLADSYIKGAKFKKQEQAAQEEADMKAGLQDLASKSGGLPSAKDLAKFYFSRGDAKTGAALHGIAKQEEKEAKSEAEKKQKMYLQGARDLVDSYKKFGKEGFDKVFPLLQQGNPEALGKFKPEDFHFDEKSGRDVVATPIQTEDGAQSPGWFVYDRKAGPEGSIHIIKNEDLQAKTNAKRALTEHERVAVDAQKARNEAAKIKLEQDKMAAKKAHEAVVKTATAKAVDGAFRSAGIDPSNASPEQAAALKTIHPRAEELVKQGIPPDLAVNQASLEYHDPKLKKAWEDRTDTDVQYIDDNYDFKVVGNGDKKELVITGRKPGAKVGKTKAPAAQPKKKMVYDPATGTFK